MKIEKKYLTTLERCYATGYTWVNGVRHILLATEGHGACYAYVGPEYRQMTVWDGPGGTMSLIPIPGKNGDFLAVQNFLPTFQSERAMIVWAVPQQDGSFAIKTFLQLPYVHRFDILSAGGVDYFLGATLCTSKKDKDDWSDPGKIWVGTLPDSPDQEMEIKPIMEGLVKNHGYCQVVWNGRMAGCVTAEQGAFIVIPPEKAGMDWQIEQLFDFPVSDVAFCDIDGDGEYEIISIEPFHGKQIVIRKKINGRYELVWSYDKPVDFGHVVWGGKIRGVPTFIAGYRKEGAELFMVQADPAAVSPENKLGLVATVIEAGTGPSNVAILNGEEEDIIIAANRMIGEAALYLVRD